MCAPAIPLLIAATAVTGVAGTVVEHQAKSKELKFEEKQAKTNALISQKLAADALERGKLKEHRRASEARQLAGEQKTRLAKSGIDIGTGSPLDILADTRRLADIDISIIRESAERTAKGFEAEAGRFLEEAKFAKGRKKGLRIASALKATSTVLGAASTISNLKAPTSPTP